MKFIAKKHLEIPQGKFCGEKTLCGSCKWLDYSQGTKDLPRWYWCKRVSTYKDPNLNTSCSHWNAD